MPPLPKIQKSIVFLFAVLLCFIFAQVIAAQVLGLLGIYRLWVALPATLLLTAGATYLYLRWGGQGFFASFQQETTFPRWLDWALYAVGAVLIILLVLAPAAGWPYSPISETLNQDAGAYHLPKAVELYRTGNVWDLSIPYGEYPNGYESMLSFGLLLSGNETFFGAMHALTNLLVLLSLWLLARRLTRIPGGLLFALCSAGFLSALVTIQYNPFYIFMDQAFVIGKNDMFLGMSVLAVAAHAPVGRREESPLAPLVKGGEEQAAPMVEESPLAPLPKRGYGLLKVVNQPHPRPRPSLGAGMRKGTCEIPNAIIGHGSKRRISSIARDWSSSLRVV
jgi:hypothetical protein